MSQRRELYPKEQILKVGFPAWYHRNLIAALPHATKST
jgi:hypothetical protein